jgi:hypothetical protein
VWPDTVTAEAGFLAQDPTILSATPVSPKAAVGLLEDGLVQLSGGVGVIHAPRLALGVIASDWPLRQSGGRLLTLLDTPVALGGGYDGAGADHPRPRAGSPLGSAARGGPVHERRADHGHPHRVRRLRLRCPRRPGHPRLMTEVSLR